MIDYYVILNLKRDKQNGTITDEKVKAKYLEKRQQGLKMSDAKKNDYLTVIEDAYSALSSENARKHYDELLEKIKEHIDSQRKNKSTNINFEEMIKQTKTLDTKQLLEEIKLKASQKHPIPEPKDVSSGREIEQ